MDVDTGIDMKELECLAQVVETGNFSRAAARLNLSQSTVSTHISTLERKVGMRLILRGRKESEPSDAGKILYDHAKRILKLREKAQEAIQNFMEDRTDAARRDHE